jgi:tetratricopeptide (TPR) repeat protein
MRLHWSVILVSAALMAGLAAMLQPAAIDQVEADNELNRLQAQLAFEPDAVEAHYRLGLLLAALEPQEALAHLDAASGAGSAYRAEAQLLARSIRTAQLAGDPAFSLVSIGRTLAVMGEWALAADTLERAVVFAPDYAEAWAYLGEARQQLGGGGLEALQTALALDPQSLAANLFLGLYWQRQGNYAQADTFLQTAHRLDPENRNALLQLGWNSALAGDVLEARGYFEAARDLAPDDPESWKALARYSAEFEVYLDEVGLIAAHRALVMAPEDPEAHLLMGRILFLRGDSEAAIEKIQAALALDDGYVEAWLHLGLVYLVADDQAAAIAALEQVIALAPGSNQAVFAEELIRDFGP